MKVVVRIGILMSCMLHLSGAITSFEEGMDSGYNPRLYANSNKLKNQYEQHNYEKVPLSATPLIPKKIHQIWIGGEVPEKFRVWMETWKEKHPDWQYYLWTDADIADFHFAYPDTFVRADNVGAKSDIWRYEILNQQGGVYVDVDLECIAPLDILVMKHPFFTGIGGFDYINNAIIGSKPGHPLLQKMLKILSSTGKQQLNTPWYNTGPLFFTKQSYAYLKNHPDEGTIYPVRFFYPLPNEYRFAQRRGELSAEFIQSFFIPETFTVHYWAESWKD